MIEAAPRFLDDVERILSRLSHELGPGGHKIEITPDRRTELRAGVVRVPESSLQHWLRFHTLPTMLVRDLAYLAKQASLAREGWSGPGAEADAHAFAEQFLRRVSLQDTD